jgi:hypothetical protein
MLVDPANRLVAAGLEAEWNTRLSELAMAEDELAGLFLAFRRGHPDVPGGALAKAWHKKVHEAAHFTERCRPGG